MIRIALVGDFDSEVLAHRAIPLALAQSRDSLNLPLEWTWLHTSSLTGDVTSRLAAFDGVWCVPASPYENTNGALGAIRNARRTRVPFLGTCGGFQHAILDYAEDVWKIDARHAELEPSSIDPLIAPLTCSLGQENGDVTFSAGSRLAIAYGLLRANEGYHCSYGLNPRYAERLEAGPLRATAHDDAGDVLAIELEGHPFFVATLFQPERAALRGVTPPVVRAFVEAAASQAKG